MANLVVFRDSSLVDVDEDLLPLKTHGYRLANLLRVAAVRWVWRKVHCLLRHVNKVGKLSGVL